MCIIKHVGTKERGLPEIDRYREREREKREAVRETFLGFEGKPLHLSSLFNASLSSRGNTGPKTTI